MNAHDEIRALARADDETLLATLRGVIDRHDGAQTALYGPAEEMTPEAYAAFRVRITPLCSAVHRCQPGTIHSPRPLTADPHPAAQGSGQTTRPASLDGRSAGSSSSGRSTAPVAGLPDTTPGGVAAGPPRPAELTGAGRAMANPTPVHQPAPGLGEVAAQGAGQRDRPDSVGDRKSPHRALLAGPARRIRRAVTPRAIRRVLTVSALVLIGGGLAIGLYGLTLARLFDLI